MENKPRKKKYLVHDPTHNSNFMLAIQYFNRHQNYTDLCFVCARGVKVYAHKLLFCAVSKLLKDIILQMPEGLETITVHVPDVESYILQLIIELLYEGQVRLTSFAHKLFNECMNLLGIEPLSSSSNKDKLNLPEDSMPAGFGPPAIVLPASPTPVPQIIYQVPSSQGRVQYVLAPSPMVQGSQMSPVIQPPLISPASMAQVRATGGRLLQLQPNTGYNQMTPHCQMVSPFHSPMIQQAPLMPMGPMLPSPGQLLQPVSGPIATPSASPSANQTVPSTNSLMVHSPGHVLQSSTVPSKKKLIRPADDLPEGKRMPMPIVIDVKPPMSLLTSQINRVPHSINRSQVVIQNNKTTVINKNHTEINIHNQGPSGSSTLQRKTQASPHKVNSNSNSTHQERPHESVKKQTDPKLNPQPPATETPLPTPPTSADTDPPAEKVIEPEMEEILSILGPDLRTVSAQQIHDKVKEKFGIDIPNEDIESSIRLCISQGESNAEKKEERSEKKRAPRKRRKTGSDDEDDKDFVPYRPTKDLRKKRSS